MDDEGAPNPRAAAMAGIEAVSLAIAVRSIPRMLEPLRTSQLTLQQLRVLAVVVTTGGGASVAELGRDFAVALPSMSNLVDRLVASGVAERRKDPDDLRVRRVHATDLGRAVVREVMGARPELGADILARLTTDELVSLEAGLSALARVLRSDAGR